MEYIRGQTLKEIWPKIEVPQKEDIAKQIAAQFAELCALPPLGSFGRVIPPEFGNLPKLPLVDFLFETAEGDIFKFGGPFEDMGQLAKGLGESMVSKSSAGFLQRAEILASFIPKILTEGPPVFTHADIHTRSFILTGDGRVAIINWEQSGWYPACWEYSYAIYAGIQELDTDWALYIPKFLDMYASECCLTLIMRQMYIGVLY